MPKLLSLIISLSLAAFLFTSAFAGGTPASTTDTVAKPTKQHGQGHGNNGQGNGQGHARGGPCGQPGQAQGGGDAGKTHYDGVLATIGTSSITISTTLSGTVIIDVTDTTCIRMPPRKGLGLGDLAVGMRVGVQTVAGPGSNPVAVRIQVHKPRKVTYVGTVTDLAPGVSVTLQPEAGGSPLSFALTATTEIKPWHRAGDLAVGQRVTLQAVRDFVGAYPPSLRIIIHGPEADDD